MSVASFTDAWIETGLTLSGSPSYLVASFTDAWIETRFRIQSLRLSRVASFTDAWIETRLGSSLFLSAAGRVLHGRVD